MEIVLTALIAMALGALIGALVMRADKVKLLTEKDGLKAQLMEARQKVNDEREASAERLKEEKAEWQQTTKDMLAKQEQHHREALDAQQARFDETMAKVSAQVKSATDDMLRQRQREFAVASNENLGQIVTPLRDTIDRMKRAMQESTMTQTALSGELKANIATMIQQSEAARRTAEELTRAFKHGSKVQGDWGERVLNELLESQGLTQGVHYDVQTFIRNAKGEIVVSDQGAKMRPDVILHLDQRREIIIDSKVSMTAFLDYVNAETEADREKYLQLHVESLQKHVKELATKDYSHYIQPPKVRMDYVIMFVPHSGALWTALNARPELWRKAMERNVFIADEQTLFAALRIISLTWTQIAQAQNHEKVYALASEMLDRVGQFMKKYQNLGKALETALKAYEEGEKKLQPSGQSILQTCAKLTKLGAQQSDRNPLPQLADSGELPAVEEIKGLPETASEGQPSETSHSHQS